MGLGEGEGVIAMSISVIGRMEGVREYAEEFPVELGMQNGRVCIVAINEGGCNSVAIDLLDVLRWAGVEGSLDEILARKGVTA